MCIIVYLDLFFVVSTHLHIRMLEKGWFSFVFTASTDVSWVLSKTWSMDGTPIVMKQWTPSFDAKRERVDVVHV